MVNVKLAQRVQDAVAGICEEAVEWNGEVPTVDLINSRLDSLRGAADLVRRVAPTRKARARVMSVIESAAWNLMDLRRDIIRSSLNAELGAKK